MPIRETGASGVGQAERWTQQGVGSGSPPEAGTRVFRRRSLAGRVLGVGGGRWCCRPGGSPRSHQMSWSVLTPTRPWGAGVCGVTGPCAKSEFGLAFPAVGRSSDRWFFLSASRGLGAQLLLTGSPSARGWRWCGDHRAISCLPQSQLQKSERRRWGGVRACEVRCILCVSGR